MENKLILIIDDDKAVQQAINQFFKYKGFNAVSASDGQKAIDLIETNNDIDLILLDLMMPVMDGFEFLEKRAKNKNLKKIPVVVMSAGEELPEEGSYDDLLKKPFKMNELIETVEKLCP